MWAPKLYLVPIQGCLNDNFLSWRPLQYMINSYCPPLYAN